MKLGSSVMAILLFSTLICFSFTGLNFHEGKKDTSNDSFKKNPGVSFGKYSTAKTTNKLYKTVHWKTLELKQDGKAVWTWYMDFENSTLRNDNDDCFWEKDQFQMTFKASGNGNFELVCQDNKMIYCDGEVKQRSCFNYPVVVRITEEGLFVDNGDNDGVYSKQ